MAHYLTKCLLTAVLLLFTAVATTHAQALPATVTAVPEVLELTAGSTAQIALTVTNVRELYGFDLALAFDPAVVEVVDADASLDGTQVGFGTLLDAGFVIRNTADNQLGRVHFVMTQLSPSPPKSGSGTLIVLTLRGKQADATSPLTLVRAQLAGPEGNEILSTAVDGQIRVVTSRPPGPTATPIAVQPPGTPLAQAAAALATATPPPATVTPADSPPAAVTAAPTATPPAPVATTVAQPTADAPAGADAGVATTSASDPPANTTPASLTDTQPTRDDKMAVAGNSEDGDTVAESAVAQTGPDRAGSESTDQSADTAPNTAAAQTAVPRIGQGAILPVPTAATASDDLRSPTLPVMPGVMVILAVGAIVVLGLLLGRRSQ